MPLEMRRYRYTRDSDENWLKDFSGKKHAAEKGHLINAATPVFGLIRIQTTQPRGLLAFILVLLAPASERISSERSRYAWA